MDARGIRPPDAYADRRACPRRDGVVVLALSGEIDVAAAAVAAPALRGGARAAPRRSSWPTWREVTFADSSALRELLRADAAMRAAGTRFMLAALPPVVERLLELTRARELLDVAPSVEAALRPLDGRR